MLFRSDIISVGLNVLKKCRRNTENTVLNGFYKAFRKHLEYVLIRHMGKNSAFVIFLLKLHYVSLGDLETSLVEMCNCTQWPIFTHMTHTDLRSSVHVDLLSVIKML